MDEIAWTFNNYNNLNTSKDLDRVIKLLQEDYRTSASTKEANGFIVLEFNNRMV